MTHFNYAKSSPLCTLPKYELSINYALIFEEFLKECFVIYPPLHLITKNKLYLSFSSRISPTLIKRGHSIILLTLFIKIHYLSVATLVPFCHRINFSPALGYKTVGSLLKRQYNPYHFILAQHLFVYLSSPIMFPNYFLTGQLLRERPVPNLG
jgi:hypothetical protein